MMWDLFRSWLRRRPVRNSGLLILAAAILFGVSYTILTRNDQPTAVAAATTPPTTTRASITPTPEPRASVADPTQPPPPTASAVQDAADAFVDAWLSPGSDEATWEARLKPLVAPQVLAQITDYGIRGVPAGAKRVGIAIVTASSSEGASVVVGTTAGNILLDLQPHDGPWIVTMMQVAEPNGQNA